jgi:hypothetical protein
MGIFDFLNKNPNQDKFAKIFTDFARKQGINKAMKYDASEFRIVVGEGTNQVFNLGNAYRDYCKVPKAERDTVLVKYTAGLNTPEIPPSFEEARKNIMPTLKGMGQLEYVRLLNLINKKDDSTVNADIFLPFSDDAVAMLAYDTEHSMRLIGPTELQNWGISLKDAMDVALSNLRDKSVDNFSQLDEGIVVGGWNDAYDTSRVLLSDIVYRSGIGNDPIFMIPSRGCLLVTSSSNIAGQLRMIDYAWESIQKDGRFLSSLMYRMVEGKVVQHHPEQEEIKNKLAKLKRQNLAEDYASQKNLLEKLHEKTGEDVFVATYTLTENKEKNRLTSLGSWTKGVDTLLPQTDIVALVTPGDGNNHAVKLVAWKDALEIGGDLMSVVDGYPIRYRVTEFPAPEKLSLVPVAEL